MFFDGFSSKNILNLADTCTLCFSTLSPWKKDRYMAPDIDAVTKLLQEEKVHQNY